MAAGVWRVCVCASTGGRRFMPATLPTRSRAAGPRDHPHVGGSAAAVAAGL